VHAAPAQYTGSGYIAAWHSDACVLPHGTGLDGTAPPFEQQFDTLLLYLYADTDRHYKRNLEFFVEHGILASSTAARVNYVIIVNTKVQMLRFSQLVWSDAGSGSAGRVLHVAYVRCHPSVANILHPMLSGIGPAATASFCVAGCRRRRGAPGPSGAAVERALRHPRGHWRLPRLGRLRVGAGRGGRPAPVQTRRVPQLERPWALSACVLAGATPFSNHPMQRSMTP